MKYTLKHPIELGQSTITTLTLREYAVAADYLAFDERGGVKQNLALIASMSGQDVALIERMSGADYSLVIAHCEGLIAKAWDEAHPSTTGPAADATEMTEAQLEAAKK